MSKKTVRLTKRMRRSIDVMKQLATSANETTPSTKDVLEFALQYTLADTLNRNHVGLVDVADVVMIFTDPQLLTKVCVNGVLSAPIINEEPKNPHLTSEFLIGKNTNCNLFTSAEDYSFSSINVSDDASNLFEDATDYRENTNFNSALNERENAVDTFWFETPMDESDVDEFGEEDSLSFPFALNVCCTICDRTYKGILLP